MGQTTGIDVKKHDITGTSPTTRTFAHESRGAQQWAVAVRADFTTEEDELLITIKQRVPGRNSDTEADDYYDDEPMALFGVSGRPGQIKVIAKAGSGGEIGTGGRYFVEPEDGQQHVANIFWPPAASEMVVTVEEKDVGVALKAVTTWEVP